MGAEDNGCGDAGSEAQPEQPLLAIKPRGRPSNWVKKFAVQQMKESREQTNKSAHKNNSQREAQAPPNESPDRKRASQQKSARTRARKPKGGIYNPDQGDTVSETVSPSALVTPGLSKSPSPAPQPAVKAEDDMPVIRDDDSLFGGDAGSLFVEDIEPENSARTPSHVASPVVGDDEREQSNGPQSARPFAHLASLLKHTNVEAELHTMADEVRRWEAVTQQVATSTAEMAALVRDLAAKSFASRPPSATVRDMLSAEDQARFRDQLLKATQLSLKADLVQTLKERDSEARRMQVYCVVVLAVAVVLAAFMVSPFAGQVVEWMDWAVVG